MKYISIILFSVLSISGWAQSDTTSVIQYLEEKIKSLESINITLNEEKSSLSRIEVDLEMEIRDLRSDLVISKKRADKLDKSKVKIERDELLSKKVELETKLSDIGFERLKLKAQVSSQMEIISKDKHKVVELEGIIADLQAKLNLLSAIEVKANSLEKTVLEQEGKLENFRVVKEKLLDDLNTELSKFISTGDFNIEATKFKEIGKDISKWSASDSNSPKVIALSKTYNDWKRKSTIIADGKEALTKDYDAFSLSKLLTRLNSLGSDTNIQVKSTSINLTSLLQNYAKVYCRVRQVLEDFEYLSTEDYRLDDIVMMKEWAKDYPFLVSGLETKKQDIMSNEHSLKKLAECN